MFANEFVIKEHIHFYFSSVSKIISILITSIGRLATYLFSWRFMTSRVRKNKSPVFVSVSIRFLFDRKSPKLPQRLMSNLVFFGFSDECPRFEFNSRHFHFLLFERKPLAQNNIQSILLHYSLINYVLNRLILFRLINFLC